MLPQDKLALAPSEYFLRNIWVTTSGLFSLPPVLCTVQVLGVDRVMFSVDYPFGDNAAGRAMLDALPLAPADKAKIAGGNAERVLGLSGEPGPGLPGPVERDLSHDDVVKKFASAKPFTAQWCCEKRRSSRGSHPGPGRAADPRARAVHRRHARRSARAHACRHPAPSGQPAGRGPHRDQDGQDLREPGPRPPGQGLRHHRRGPQRVRARLRRPGHATRCASWPRRRAPTRSPSSPAGRCPTWSAGTRPRWPGATWPAGSRRWPRRCPPTATPPPQARRPRSAAQAEGGEQLCQHHCPVAHVAAEFPQLCEAETEAFGRLLGTPVQRLATIAHGDGICTTHVTGVGKPAHSTTGC